MKRLVLSIVLAFGGLAAAQAAIKEGPVEYKAGDTVLKGSVVLEMARAGEDLRGVASFHGGLATEHPAQPDRTQARVLVMNGAGHEKTSPTNDSVIEHVSYANG